MSETETKNYETETETSLVNSIACESKTICFSTYNKNWPKIAGRRGRPHQSFLQG